MWCQESYKVEYSKAYKNKSYLNCTVQIPSLKQLWVVILYKIKKTYSYCDKKMNALQTFYSEI